MEEEKMNATHQEEVVQPQNVEDMDAESFAAYIESVKQGDGEVQANPTGGTVPAEKNEPYMSFATKEELQEFQNRTIGKRLAEIREADAERKKEFDGLIQLAKKRYQTDESEEALQKLMQEIFVEGHKNEALEIQVSQKAEEIEADWYRQEKALRERVPEFSLEDAFANPEFYKKVVLEHASIAEAYLFTKAETPPVRSIREVGNAPGGIGGRVNTDVRTMSDSEFDAYIKKIKNT